MAQSPKALVDRAVLEWLRSAAGLSTEEAARRIQTKPAKIETWEKGDDRPTMSQLRKLARAYKRPISDFFLPRPMKEPDIPHDFRRLPAEGAQSYSPALRHEIRLAYRRRTLALDLAEELEVKLPEFVGRGSVTDKDDPEKVGERVRAMLRVTADEQQGWRDPRTGYNAWRKKIEDAGVLVFQVTTVDKAQMLGFSLSLQPLPVVAVNRKLKQPNGRTFTLLHEFTHLLLGEGGVCDIEEDLLRPAREQAIEVFCNHVAGAALVPKSDLLAHPLLANDQRTREWPDETIKALARHFSASGEVVLRRLLIFGRATQAFYNLKRREYLARLARIEQEERERNTDDFGRNMAREAVSNLGAFARLIVNSYTSDTINLTDASKFLGVKAEKVAAVSELLR
jgi:Zn-dependent peptidase ImmA (M78 family)/DNA-binding XRE family transcriptional regulator